MYRIEVDNEVVHEFGSDDDEYSALTAELINEFNRSGTLDFSVPSCNYALQSNKIKKLISPIKVYRNTELIWKGRVLDQLKDFYNNVSYKCEGWLSVLCDSVVRPIRSGLPSSQILTDGVIARPMDLMRLLIADHNSQVGEDKSFQLYIRVLSENSPISTETFFPQPNYESTMDYIQANFINNELIGGHIWVSDNNLYYYDDGMEDYSGQEIVFGENLLDLSEYIDASKIYTVLIPTGKDGLTLGSTDYVENQSAIRAFGRIVRHEDFSEIEDIGTLRSEAILLLSKNIESNMTIELSAFDLSLINVDTDKIEVGSYSKIISSPHGINSNFICTESKIDLCNPAVSTYSFGVGVDTLTDKQNKMAMAMMRSSSNYRNLNDSTTLEYQLSDNRVQILSGALKKTGRSVSLSFRIEFLSEATGNISFMTFSSKYAPSYPQNGSVYDETSMLIHSLGVSSSGVVTINILGSINNGDILSGSINWQN